MNCRRCERGLTENTKDWNRFFLCNFCVFDASYSRLLRTNAIPSANERKVLESQLEQQRASLSNLDLEVAAYKVPSDTLETERSFQRKRLQLYESAVSPVRYLPGEIWIQAFCYVIETSESKRIRLTLSHVCCKWRELILTNPSFWNAVTLDEETKELGDKLFSKAGNTIPIDLTIRLNPSSGRGLVLEWMAPYICRLKRLKFIGSVPAFPWSEPFTTLSHISFYDTRFHDGARPNFQDVNKGQFTGCLTAPLLRTVVFDGIAQPLDYPIKFNHLTSLVIQSATGLPIDPLIKTLVSISSTLENLTVGLSPTQPDLFTHSSSHLNLTIHFPKLTHIKFCFHKELDTRWFLNSITTPALVSIRVGRSSPKIWTETVASLIDRSSAAPREAGLGELDKSYKSIVQFSVELGDSIGSTLAILSTLPSISTIQIYSDKLDYSADELVEKIMSESATWTQSVQILYQYRRQDEEKMAISSPHQTVELADKKPAIVLARGDLPVAGLDKVQKYEDLRGVAHLLGGNGPQRIDIFTWTNFGLSSL